MHLNLTDTALTINGVVSHCKCACRHCLLFSGEGLLKDVPFEKLHALAFKFKDYAPAHGFDASLCVYNCSDYPELPRAMEADRILSKYYGYQNLNGTPIREGWELADWVTYLKRDCGLTHANLSWFGMREYHDWFARAEGYFDYLMNLAAELQKQQIPYSNSIFLLKSNLGSLPELHEALLPLGGEMHYSLLDYRGGAKRLLHEFLTPADVPRMPAFLFEGGVYNVKRNRFHSEWVSAVRDGTAPKLAKRSMFLVANPENIDDYLSMSCDGIVALFHDIDRRLQDAIPSIDFLAENYGKSAPEILLDFRSALWLWMDLYFADAGLDQSLLFSDLRTSVMWR